MPRLSQMELCGGIMKLVDRLGAKTMNSRQSNAIIEAADIIVAAFEQEHQKAVPGTGYMIWLRSDETGLSSRYMLRVMMPKANVSVSQFGSDNNVPQYPRDPSDFGRCIGLLEAEPNLRDLMHLLAEGHGQHWKALIGAWPELEALYREELPSGKAPRLYARMQELFDEAEKTK